jgi:hypothetical protein
MASPFSDQHGKKPDSMNLRPLYDRIVVKRIEEQETTRKGIVIAAPPKRKRRRAKPGPSVMGRDSKTGHSSRTALGGPERRFRPSLAEYPVSRTIICADSCPRKEDRVISSETIDEPRRALESSTWDRQTCSDKSVPIARSRNTSGSYHSAFRLRHRGTRSGHQKYSGVELR